MKDQRVYLLEIVERIDRILEYTSDGQDTFMASTLIQDAVLRNFQVIGEAVKRMDDDFRAQHSDVNWRQLTGFRDVLIHEYDQLIPSQVWKAIDDLRQIRERVNKVLQEINQEDDTDSE